jgi:ubiquinone/menaquinone biosynthesis C-methylase UbiE
VELVESPAQPQNSRARGRVSFDLLAPHYRWLEAILAGGKLHRCRTAFLDRVVQCREILLCGEGNGRFLVECRRNHPRARITCLDSSTRMLDCAAERLERFGLAGPEIQFIRSDALEWDAPTHRYDLIVTHFFLDCFHAAHLERIIRKLSCAARRKATWLLADFRAPRAGPLRWRARAIHQLMYGFFRVATGISASRIVLPDSLLAAEGFHLAEKQSSEWGLLSSELWKREDPFVETL